MTQLQMQMRSWRHIKHPDDLYTVVCLATQEGDHVEVVVYESQSGKVWTRPKSEFLDGRFEWLNQSTGEWEKPQPESQVTTESRPIDVRSALAAHDIVSRAMATPNGQRLMARFEELQNGHWGKPQEEVPDA